MSAGCAARRAATAAASGIPSTTARSNKSASPAAAAPRAPETAITSPTRAPERSTGERPSRSPKAVTAIVNVSDTERSPPTTPHPGASCSQAPRKPSAMPSRKLTAVSAGAAIATTSAVGTAPIAATSERFVAAAFQPRSWAADHASLKSGP